jgi:uncharacterized FAD-dependent dehydrogenase
MPLEFTEKDLFSRVLNIIGLSGDEVERISVERCGLDARRKGSIRRVYTVSVVLRAPALEKQVAERVSAARAVAPAPDPFPAGKVASQGLRPVVVGTGPAGLFCALTLARFGAPPLVLERGRPVEERSKQVAAFWDSGVLDPEGNVQFGEGGAGTFSDGKLTTRIGDPLAGYVIGVFEEYAELPGLRVDAKPHVGTDRLRLFCRRIRRELANLGAEIRFGTRMDDIDAGGGRVRAVRLAGGGEVECEDLVVAIGHSARDTRRMLRARGVEMSAKGFAVGFRVEHPQPLIDRIQYGKAAERLRLPPADYRLAVRVPSGRSVYSFCMCPGGFVLAAPSGPGEMCVNGMSFRGRDSGFANGGIVAAVSPADFGTRDAEGAVSFQEGIEERAFRKGGGGFGIPAANLMGFLEGKDLPPAGGKVLAPRVVGEDLSGILPGRLEEDIRDGLRAFGRSLRGFLGPDATLYAAESRTSSPVRMERENYESRGVKGLYPVGEGAGHAGGIVSSAVDGIRGALRILEKHSVKGR